MKTLYSIEYEDDRNGLSITSITPCSAYLHDIFYDGTLLKDVHLGDTGRFMLDVWLDDQDNFEIEAKFKWRGWREVEI